MVEETSETRFSSRRWSHHAYEYGNSRRDRPLFVPLPLWSWTLTATLELDDAIEDVHGWRLIFSSGATKPWQSCELVWVSCCLWSHELRRVQVKEWWTSNPERVSAFEWLNWTTVPQIVGLRKNATKPKKPGLSFASGPVSIFLFCFPICMYLLIKKAYPTKQRHCYCVKM